MKPDKKILKNALFNARLLILPVKKKLFFIKMVLRCNQVVKENRKLSKI